MALEKALWGRLLRGKKALQAEKKFRIHMERVENEIAAGNPDVDGCGEGMPFMIELKTCMRPAREVTPIKPKLREKQIEWHKNRTDAGSRTHWVLLQVGEGKDAKLYLIPGKFFNKENLHCPESDLELISVCDPGISAVDVIRRVAQAW
jgi:hypothetical protein